MPIDNKVKTVFAALNNNFQSVQADSGLGSLGWWPEEGNHDCLVTDVNMQDSTFKQKDGQTFPGFEIQVRTSRAAGWVHPFASPRTWAH
jgi:hypothetical protein